jgi:hypothetical protein
MLNVVSLVVLIAVGALLVWSSIRAWRAKNNFLRWGGASLAALAATAVSLVTVLTIAGLLKLHIRTAPVPDLKVAGTPHKISAVRLSPTASVTPAIQKRAHSPAAWTSANISQSQQDRSFPPT